MQDENQKLQGDVCVVVNVSVRIGSVQWRSGVPTSMLCEVCICGVCVVQCWLCAAVKLLCEWSVGLLNYSKTFLYPTGRLS